MERDRDHDDQQPQSPRRGESRNPQENDRGEQPNRGGGQGQQGGGQGNRPESGGNQGGDRPQKKK